jgi:peptidoglycan/xylan/chitin deacetylase (PgdA/CDA1 family)
MLIISKNNEKSFLGLKSILDIEKIPHMIADESSVLKNKSCVKILDNYEKDTYDCEVSTIFTGRLNEKLLFELFGISDYQKKDSHYIEVNVENDFFTRRSQDLLGKYNRKGLVRLPCKEYYLLNIEDVEDIQVMATLGESKMPAIIKKDNIVWCLFDIGSLFFDLTNEIYLNRKEGDEKKKNISLFSSNLFQKVYYHIPSFLRALVQRASLGYLQGKLNIVKDKKFRTNYPIDITGWFLIQTLRSLVIKLKGHIIAINKMPAKYKSAFVFTHDIEPTTFSYTKGLPYLLKYLKKNANNYSTVHLVSSWAKKYCNGLKEELKDYEVNCQGLYHDNKTPDLSYEDICWRVKTGKTILKELLEKEIHGYRSPRLNRSQYLIRAIEKAGYKYSSSFVDVDRENARSFGGGVSINYPFRPAIIEENGLRQSNFLEFPVTAPDCIMPLFIGEKEDQLYKTYEEKINYTCDIHGAFICLVHAGVFDEKDIKIRTRLLNYLHKTVGNNKEIWLTNLKSLYKWWCQREKINFILEEDGFCLTSNNENPLYEIAITMEAENEIKEKHVSSVSSKKSVKINKEYFG